MEEGGTSESGRIARKTQGWYTSHFVVVLSHRLGRDLLSARRPLLRE